MELLFELLLQLVAEVFWEVGLRALARTFQPRKNPWLATFGFVLWGSLAGGLSLLAFPHSFIASPRTAF